MRKNRLCCILLLTFILLSMGTCLCFAEGDTATTSSAVESGTSAAIASAGSGQSSVDRRVEEWKTMMGEEPTDLTLEEALDSATERVDGIVAHSMPLVNYILYAAFGIAFIVTVAGLMGLGRCFLGGLVGMIAVGGTIYFLPEIVAHLG